MKKWISCLLGIAFTFAGVGCKSGGEETQVYTATAEYVHTVGESGRADFVYGGCELFFELPDGEPVVAGDVFYVEYTGMMYVLQSYPGQVRINEGKVVGVRRERAKILSLVYVPKTETDDAYFKAVNGENAKIRVSHAPNFYITDAETGAYASLSALKDETVLYAAYSPLDGFDAETGYRFSAFYSHDPRARA